MSKMTNLWNSKSEQLWRQALERYWNYVRPGNLKLEHEMNELKLEEITKLDAVGWYNFLKHKYFRWKYTAPNRYTTTTTHLKSYIDKDQLDKLYEIKNELLGINLTDIGGALKIAVKIKGLGIAGASGLLSLLYPHVFGTVDQFVVKALQEIPNLPEREKLIRMNPDNLSLTDGIILINIMRDKAEENNKIFNVKYWSPRKIDMVLWATRDTKIIHNNQNKQINNDFANGFEIKCSHCSFHIRLMLGKYEDGSEAFLYRCNLCGDLKEKSTPIYGYPDLTCERCKSEMEQIDFSPEILKELPCPICRGNSLAIIRSFVWIS